MKQMKSVKQEKSRTIENEDQPVRIYKVKYIYIEVKRAERS